MRDADTAMYQAKARGKARHEMFDADMHARARDRLGLENDLRHAVGSKDFEVHYQPIVSLSSGMCVGFESLVRWTRKGEAVQPATFIPIAEELGLIEPLGTWVLQQACRTFADWRKRFPNGGLECITVNVSSRQLMEQSFLLIVEEAVHAAGLKPCDLRLEITETALMDSPHEVADVLRKLRDFGVKIYLDDFGTGYSSLSHLHKLPVDALKIDRSFVKSLLLPDRPAIVESILALARTLNTSVVAEGIESEVQARELKRLGCTHAQGYLFSRPLSVQRAEALLIANQPLGPDTDLSSRRDSLPTGDPYVQFDLGTSAPVGRRGCHVSAINHECEAGARRKIRDRELHLLSGWSSLREFQLCLACRIGIDAGRRQRGAPFEVAVFLDRWHELTLEDDLPLSVTDLGSRRVGEITSRGKRLSFQLHHAIGRDRDRDDQPPERNPLTPVLHDHLLDSYPTGPRYRPADEREMNERRGASAAGGKRNHECRTRL